MSCNWFRRQRAGNTIVCQPTYRWTQLDLWTAEIARGSARVKRMGGRGNDLPSIDSSLSITTDFDDVVLPDVDEIQAIRLDTIHDTLEIVRRLEFRRQAILGEVSA